MSSIRSIWSGVRRWLSGLIGGKSGQISSPKRESEKDLRDRLNERIETEKAKAQGVEKLRRELREAQGDMKDLMGQIAEVRRTSRRDLSTVSDELGEMKTLIGRLGASLETKEEELDQIEGAAQNLNLRREVRTIGAALAATILVPFATAFLLWTFGNPIPSVLTPQMRMSPTEIETIEDGKVLQKARESLAPADSARLEELIQEGMSQ